MLLALYILLKKNDLLSNHGAPAPSSHFCNISKGEESVENCNIQPLPFSIIPFKKKIKASDLISPTTASGNKRE
ncbi:MAG: hypothetical protein Fur0020_02020 [Thermodesulfovibrionia bacterium]